LDNFLQKLQFSSARIFRRKLNIIGVTLSLFHRIDADLDDLLFAFFEFVFAMDFAGGAEDVNSSARSGSDCFASAVDIFGSTAGQAADDAAVISEAMA